MNYGASRVDELLAIAFRRERLAFALAVALPSTFALGLAVALAVAIAFAVGFAFTLAVALAWSRAWQVPRPGGRGQAWTGVAGVDKYHNPWKQ